MRHDKRTVAQEATESAQVGKLIGDYVRILQFSAYAEALDASLEQVKDRINPFTGCFVSRIPVTITHLSFGLKAASLFAKGDEQTGVEFVRLGATRLTDTLAFLTDGNTSVPGIVKQEAVAWNHYYELLSKLEEALENNEINAIQIASKAKKIVSGCGLASQTTHRPQNQSSSLV